MRFLYSICLCLVAICVRDAYSEWGSHTLSPTSSIPSSIEDILHIKTATTELFEVYATIPSKTEIKTGRIKFFMKKLLDPSKVYPFRISALLYPPKGVLTYSIRTKDHDGSKGPVRGKDLYALMIRHFSGKIALIHEDWTHTEPDNLNTFNKHYLSGLKTLEEAAFATWSGNMAKSHGFDHVQVHVLFKNTQEIPTHVVALFAKTPVDLIYPSKTATAV